MSKLSLLLYDVRSTSRIAHPTTILHNRALRFQLSAWVIFEDRIPWSYLKRLEEDGNTWDVVPFADGNSAEVQKILIRNIQTELRKAQERETAALDRLDKLEEEAKGTEEGDKSSDKRAKERTKVLARSEKFLKGLEEAALLYGVALSNLTFTDSHNRLSALRRVNGVRAALVAEMTAAAVGTRFENAAKSDEMPPEILADALEEEKGVDCSAARSAVMSSNGHSPAVNGTSRSSGSMQPRMFRVQTNNGTRTVQSSLSNNEASDICRTLTESFPKDLSKKYRAGRNLSAVQTAWMHVLAVESQKKEVPAPVKVETPPVQPSTTTEPYNGIEVSSEKMSWNSTTTTLSCEASDLGIKSLNGTIRVKSHKTGNVRVFSSPKETWNTDENELMYTEYTGEGNVKLRILND